MVEIREVDDSYRDFVGEKMAKVSDEYTDEDLELAFNLEHIIIASFIDGEIVGFCLLLKPVTEYYVAYTWSKETLEAKKAFIKGIRYLVKNYPDIQFAGEKEPVMYRAYLKEKGRI